MTLTIIFAAIGLVFAVLRPLRFFAKPPFAGFGSKGFGSMFFCLAGVAATAQRDYVSWQAALLLMGLCLAAAGDIMLAAEPVLHLPEKDKNYAFVMGSVMMLLSHGLNVAALLSRANFMWQLLVPMVGLPIIYAILWATKVLRLGKAGLPVLFYALVLGAEFCAATQAGMALGQVGQLAVPAVVLFLWSNTALFLANFGRKQVEDRSRGVFLWVVILPYYVAQGLMACVVGVI